MGAHSKALATTLRGGISGENDRKAVMDLSEVDIAFLSLPVAMKAIRSTGVVVDLPLDAVPEAERIVPHDRLMRLDWKKIEPQMDAIAERWTRNIAMVFQSHALFPHMRVADNPACCAASSARPGSRRCS